jgi:biotin transport system substrate-specific component
MLVTAFIPGDLIKAVLAGLITAGLARARPAAILSRG